MHMYIYTYVLFVNYDIVFYHGNKIYFFLASCTILRYFSYWENVSKMYKNSYIKKISIYYIILFTCVSFASWLY